MTYVPYALGALAIVFILIKLLNPPSTFYRSPICVCYRVVARLELW
jgi:hypothetical protein